MLFFVLRATCAMCLKPRKNLGKTMVFAHHELLRTASARARESMKKTWENRPLDPPKPSPERLGPLQNRARSVPRRMKTNQAGQKTWQEAPHAPKKRPRAKNGANIVVQGPNKPWSAARLAPPKAC